ncbi:type II secretion system F family protein [Streptomyces sp. NPDC017979]|uniref:type II secretion system F family protein n=1 Tax=Streptomyces sp. NPDC017979 TaxID=3365024 RepID=UPI0037AEA1B5
MSSVVRLCSLAAPLLLAVHAVALLAAHRRERRTRLRIEELRKVEPGRRRPRLPYRSWAKGWAAPLGALFLGYVLVDGVLGCVVGLAAAGAVHRWQRTRAPAEVAEPDAVATRQLPLAADLLAACASAGAGPREAAAAVGESLPGAVGERLIRTAAELRLGGEPSHAWGGFATVPGAAELARCLARADSTGAPAAESISRLAHRLRAAHIRTAVAGARRAQVLITAPVGLCFLPAFLVVGVAPVVLGLATGLLHRG